jgi:PKD repeat protein
MSGFAQYNGGIGSGSKAETLSFSTCTNPPHFYAYFGGSGNLTTVNILNQTVCSTPPHFYAYMGGKEDGGSTDLLFNTTCTIPPQFFAYMGGISDGFAIDRLSLTTCSNPAQFFAYFGGSGDGFSTDGLKLTSCSALPSQFYAYLGGTGDGFSPDSLINCSVNAPVADFSADSISACAGTTVKFTDLSTKSPTVWTWTFPGGTPAASNAQNPSVIYNTPGVYDVTLRVANAYGNDTIIKSAYITVNAIPVATVSASGPTTFCPGDSVILTSSPGSSYLWSNSLTSSSIKVSASGNYSVKVSGPTGCSSTSAITGVTVHPVFTAVITPNGPTTFCQGDSVTLTSNTGSSYSWSNSSTAQFIKVYTPGTYSVTTADINGCSVSTDSVTITVNPNPAIPSVSTNGTTDLCLGDTVILTSGSASGYLWNTGSTDSSIIVTTAGTYNVKAFNGFGCGTSSSGTVVSVNDPLADFTASPLLVFIPAATVNFTAFPTGISPYTYSWSFGDATGSSASAPGHTYNSIGYQTVSLTLTDSTGCAKTITKPNYVQVEQLFPSYPMVTGTTVDITGLSFQDAVTGIISLSDGNCILSVDSGDTWSPLPTGNTEPLTDAFIIPGNWFVTGANGTILLSTNDGATWNPFSTGTTETFNGSSFSSASNGFAVGTNGTIQKYNGSGWLPQTSGTTVNLQNVYTFSTGDAIAVGDNQTILKYNGSSWLPQTSPLSFNIKDVRFSTLNDGYAAGSNGVVIKTIDGGNTWTPSLTGVDVDFNSVETLGDSAWATGTGGIVYTTIDNGAVWRRYSVGSTATQNSLRVKKPKGHVGGTGGNGRNFGPGDSVLTRTINIIGSSYGDNFSIFPNPVTDNFTISARFTATEKLIIDIKDVQGKLVKRAVNSEVFGEFKAIVNTENFNNGIYFIHIMQGEKYRVQKIIIMK